MIRYALVALLLLSVTPVSAEDFRIIQRNRAFSVATLTARVGDRLLFVNEDAITHHIFSQSARNEFEIQKQEPGQTNEVKLRAPGVVEVRCALHPRMQLTVTVNP